MIRRICQEIVPGKRMFDWNLLFTNVLRSIERKKIMKNIKTDFTLFGSQKNHGTRF